MHKNSKYKTLEYIVEHTRGAYFEVIAAFDCEAAAIGYRKECERDNGGSHYRVSKRDHRGQFRVLPRATTGMRGILD